MAHQPARARAPLVCHAVGEHRLEGAEGCRYYSKTAGKPVGVTVTVRLLVVGGGSDPRLPEMLSALAPDEVVQTLRGGALLDIGQAGARVASLTRLVAHYDVTDVLLFSDAVGETAPDLIIRASRLGCRVHVVPHA